MLRLASLAALCLPSILQTAQAFYIPGFTFNTYLDGDPILLHYNKIYSDNSALKFSYAQLPFVCDPSRKDAAPAVSGSSLALNLGEIFRGDRIVTSDLEIFMNQNKSAQLLCNKQVRMDDLLWAWDLVGGGYVAEWILDNLPGATPFESNDDSGTYYAAGFRLGYVFDETRAGEVTSLGQESEKSVPFGYYVNNHFTIAIRYHKEPASGDQPESKSIVGFEIYPKSIGKSGRDKQGVPLDWDTATEPFELSLDAFIGQELGKEVDEPTLTIPYSYSVYFYESELEWKNRWEPYFGNQSNRIHWLAIINSLVVAGLLAAVVAVILSRTLSGDVKGAEEFKLEDGAKSRRTDIGSGNLLASEFRQDDGDYASEEQLENMSGWKLVHADVFRPPPYSRFLSSLIGSGIQLLFTAGGLILLSCAGILNPSFRGGFISMGFALFIFAGLFAGYYSARLHKTFNGAQVSWRRHVIFTSIFVPGILFAILFVLNLLIWTQASSAALPFTTLLALVCLWLLVQLPLVYIGGWFGWNRAGAYDQPIKPSAIPRQLPLEAWWTRPSQVPHLWGLVPFVVVLIELMFVFKTAWQDKTGYYYLFGFLAVVSGVLTITVAEVTLIAVYLQLSREDYRWWWQSFLVGSASSLWVFAYCVYYYFFKLHVYGFVSGLLFFSYSALSCALYALLTGTVGFLTAYAFVRRIYRSVKVD